jgi:hypothetical protein
MGLAGRVAQPAGTGLALDIPAGGGLKMRNDRLGHLPRALRDRQAAGAETAQELYLVLGRDLQRRHQPGFGQSIRIARPARNILIAVAEALDVIGKGALAELAGERLREPDDGIPLPNGRIGILLFALGTLELRIIYPEWSVFVDENAGIVAHHGQRQFERRLRIKALIAIALTIDRVTGLLVDDEGAADRIGGIGRRRVH